MSETATTIAAPTPPAADPSQRTTPTPGQHSLIRSVVLHVFPGFTLAAFVVLTASTVESWGMPALFALILGIGVVIAPLELGYLSIHARRTTGSWSPLAAVDYLTKLPIRRLLLWGAVRWLRS